MSEPHILWFESVGRDDVELVGGKCASLGEMIQHLDPQGIRVPGGFAVTASAYRYFVAHNALDATIRSEVLAFERGEISLKLCGGSIRKHLGRGSFPDDLRQAIVAAYAELSRRYDMSPADVAVRSSATAEDLPDASFAGQQESFLNVVGDDAVLEACRKCFASLFTDRAISYRQQRGFDHMDVALSIAVQKMVRSDCGVAGVLFTLDTETGFPDLIVIDASWGLGESVVGGHVTPDEFRVFKPLLSNPAVKPIVERRLGLKETTLVYGDATASSTVRHTTSPADRARYSLSEDEVLELSRWAVRIEQHYGFPMDIEWAKDGVSGDLFIVQARPETVQSRKSPASLERWSLDAPGELLVEGTAVGHAIATGRVRVLLNPADAAEFQEGEVLVTTMTDPDWVPIMAKAAGIVTNHGGRTSHAAIVSRELGVPAIVGSHTATQALKNGDLVTVSCAEGDRGYVYAGAVPFTRHAVDMAEVPETETDILMIVGNPHTAFRWWNVPCQGVGLARMEFIINHVIRAHPLALLHPEKVTDPEHVEEIERLTRGYASGAEYFVDKLARGMARIAASQHPHVTIVRMSDFKSNEYADLVGGRPFEPVESNPMLGWRGASRYYSDAYRDAFALECQAVKRAREVIGLDNIVPMIPFCRTPWEADQVLAEMAKHGLVRGQDGLQVYVMVEVPSNVILADQFAERFDGFSIGSNDLTQLTLGVDRDSSQLIHLFDARDEAVKRMVRMAIDTAKATGTKIGICGQAPSDHPDFAEFLVECGIDTIAVNPDSLVDVRVHVAKAEARLRESTTT